MKGRVTGACDGAGPVAARETPRSKKGERDGKHGGLGQICQSHDGAEGEALCGRQRRRSAANQDRCGDVHQRSGAQIRRVGTQPYPCERCPQKNGVAEHQPHPARNSESGVLASMGIHGMLVGRDRLTQKELEGGKREEIHREVHEPHERKFPTRRGPHHPLANRQHPRIERAPVAVEGGLPLVVPVGIRDIEVRHYVVRRHAIRIGEDLNSTECHDHDARGKPKDPQRIDGG